MNDYKITIAGARRAELLFAVLLNFLLYHSAACTLVSIFYEVNEISHSIWMLLLILPLGIFTLSRYYVKNFIVFLILHMVTPFLGILGRAIGERLVFIFCCIIMAIISIGIRTKEKWKVNESPSLFMGSILLLCYFLGYYMKDPLIVQISYWELFLYVILYFLHENWKNSTDFIELNKDMANFPVGQITIINRFMLLLFLAALALGMFFVPKLHLEWLLMPVLKGILLLLSWLFSLLPFKEASEKIDQTTTEVGNNDWLKALGKSETSPFWAVMEQILMVVVILGVILAIIGGLSYILFRLYKGYYAEKKENTDEKEFLMGEIKWFPKHIFSRKTGEQKEKGSYSQRIRKIYKQYIKKSYKKKEPIPKTFTPKEHLVSLQVKQADSIQKIYEHARYSMEECTLAELEELKKLFSASARNEE